MKKTFHIASFMLCAALIGGMAFAGIRNLASAATRAADEALPHTHSDVHSHLQGAASVTDAQVNIYVPTITMGEQASSSSAPDLTRLPLGDGKVSYTPKAGYVYRCGPSNGGGGAFKDGPWIKSDGTFDLTAKAVVDGNVKWPNASLSIKSNGAKRTIVTKDLPINHDTGNFPISSTDDAYQYDRNPNRITEQSMTFSVPLSPTIASKPSCLSEGVIGVSISGVVIYDAMDALGRDAVAHETQDACSGHPQERGQYHYHSASNCLFGDGKANDTDLIGYALDGFGIYGPRDLSTGSILTNADLDECHGRTSEVMWEGKRVNMYHYVATYEFPYTISCFKGVK